MSTSSLRHRELVRQLYESGRPVLSKQAQAAFSEHTVKAGLRSGSVCRLLPQVLVHREYIRDRETRLRAAALWIASAGGALTGVAALWVWGVVDEAPRVTTVMVRNPLHRSTPGWLRSYRPRNGPSPMIVRGMPVAPLAHAVVHAWNETRGDEAVALVVRAVGRKHVSSADVAAAVKLTGRVRSRRKLVELLAVLVGGVTSFLEHRARTKVFLPDRYPELRWQEPITACGRDRVLDIFDPVARIDIELDSAAFHGDVSDRLDDIERDADLAAIDIETLRLDFDLVFNHPEVCRQRYERIRSARLARREQDPPASR